MGLRVERRGVAYGSKAATVETESECQCVL